jgi:hypothetical protein
MTDIVTADGRMAVSLLVLARLVGCHRDQFRAWRKLGAPADLDLRAWHRWLTETRRWTFAANLAKAMGDEAEVDPPPAGEEAPAAQGTPPGDAMTEIDADRRYKVARAQRAEMEYAELQGRLVERVLLERAVQRLAAVVVERVQRGIWDALVPALDGATPDTRRACRDAHDRAVLAMRADLGASAVRRVLMEVLPTKETA